jgi:putative ABC transport system substrate-binding protein
MDVAAAALFAVLVLSLEAGSPALAQDGSREPRIISFVAGPPDCPMTRLGQTFSEALRDLGRNPARVERRCYNDQVSIPRMIREIVDAKPSVLVVWGSPVVARLVKEATSTLPVVLVDVPDPVGNGFVESLARPGGNITGLASDGDVLLAKRVELLKHAVPRARRIGLIAHIETPRQADNARLVQAAAPALGMEARIYPVRSRSDLADAFSAMERDSMDAVMLMPSTFFWPYRAEVVALARRHRLPDMYSLRSYVELGGLLSYATDLAEMSRRAATYVDRILKGAKPGDLPVEQPIKFDFVVNAKTARTLGLVIPPPVLLRASEVID